MKVRSGSVVLLLSAFVVATSLVATIHGANPLTPSAVVAHEWGTFTSIAGEDGQAVTWQPLSGPTDLPCFVTRLNPNSYKSFAGFDPVRAIKATVRMETPVIYFYSPRREVMRVNVQFPRGVITEWYPRAYVPTLPINDLSTVRGQATWIGVTVQPDALAPRFLREREPSHYYAARETDATPIAVVNESEKFLFYRGLASFDVPIRATIADDGRVAVENVSPRSIPQLILFQNSGGRMGFRVAGELDAAVTLDMPPLTANFETLRPELQEMLVTQGLYEREAAAMIETWRDSWFDEGTRLFYIVPRAAVDELLPLTIDPAPAEIARAFVGRIEIITAAVLDDVEQAILTNNLPKLLTCGRLLDAIIARIRTRPSLAGRQEKIDNMMRLVAASHAAEPRCQ
ncbi:MAG TPA: hypothetical protein VFO19_12990 [Vicinamibacterales bacterium]|nr:hypothetical protein [Vicinamibacterales bacterium]